VEGYEAGTYGDHFADVYDEWYGAGADTDACVDTLADLAAGGPVLELGVGTGRLALPLANRGLEVTGVDASTAMLAALAAKPGGGKVRAVEADMAGPLPDGPWALVVLARNTLFNLSTEAEQQRCLSEVAGVLGSDGGLVVEGFVPDGTRERSSVEVREVGTDRVVLFVDRHDPDTQQAWSSFVELTPTGNRFRPCHIRYATPDQLDAMAAAAGLALAERWSGWGREPFDADSPGHVSLYRRRHTMPEVASPGDRSLPR
jgi:SAM-dependent methyltransferase